MAVDRKEVRPGPFDEPPAEPGELRCWTPVASPGDDDQTRLGIVIAGHLDRIATVLEASMREDIEHAERKDES